MSFLFFFWIMTLLLYPSTAHADPVSLTVAAVASGVGVTATTFSFVNAAIGAAIALVGQVLAKPDKPDLSSFGSFRSSGATQQFRQSVSERRLVYGECRVSGPIVYAGVTDNNKYLHMVIALASHEVEEIDEVFINDVSIASDQINSNGIVTSGRFKNVVRIKKYLGSNDQLADADLTNDVSEWGSSHRLRGIAYLYVRLEWDRNIFTTGIPNFSAWVKGKKCMDSRDDTTYWTPNIALITHDYLTDNNFGLEARVEDVDQNSLIGSSNTAEEYVVTQPLTSSFDSVETSTNIITLSGDRLQYQVGDRVRITSGSISGLNSTTDYYVIPVQRKDNPRIKLASSLEDALRNNALSLLGGSTGSITKNAEPRYFGGGVIKTSSERGENLKEIMSAMAGQCVYAGGQWRILCGEYQTPTIKFDESDLAGPIDVTTRISKKDRFNHIQGVYVSPLNDGNPSDYPLVKNDIYEILDEQILRRNFDLSFTQRPHTAQRIAKIALERMRQEIVFTAKFKLTAFKVQVGDNFYFNFDRYGWNNKVFEVMSWALTNSDGAPAIELIARENDISVYDWNNGEETSVDPAPNSSLSNPFEVPPPTGLFVTPIEIRTARGDLVYEFELQWTPPVDPLVTSGGYYEIQFKRSIDDIWKTSFRAEDEDTEILVKQVQPATNYDVRIRAVNYLGVRSQWQELLGFNTSSPSGATITLDYGKIIGTVTEIDDFGRITDSEITDIDFGEIN